MEYLKLITELADNEESSDIYLKDGSLYVGLHKVSSEIFNLNLVLSNTLEEELYNRAWLIWPRVFVKDNNLYYQINLTNLLNNPTVLSNEYCDVTSNDCKKYSSDLTIDNILEEDFNNSFLNIMNLINSNKEGIQLYYHLSDLFDLVKHSCTIEIISDNDNNYTNILNLSKYIRPNSYCSITIKYVKNNEITAVDKMFELSDKDCNSLNFFTTLDKTSGCTLEYQDYCLRVFPGINISECIITNCHITYEYN